MAMDYSNERYVRVYTRDTTTWKLLDWRARTVLLHMFRKVDRSGVIDVGCEGLDGLAALLELPLEIVEAGIETLTSERRGVVVARGTTFTIPNFIDAQEAPSSQAFRSREHRARKRDKALHGETARNENDESDTKRDACATKRDATATARNSSSQPGTPSRSDPSQSDLSISETLLAGFDPNDSDQVGKLATETWKRLSETRTELAKELGLPAPLRLAPITPGSFPDAYRELQKRIWEEASEAPRVIAHIFEVLIAQARKERSLEWLAEKMFTPGCWRKARSETPKWRGTPAAPDEQKPKPKTVVLSSGKRVEVFE